MSRSGMTVPTARMESAREPRRASPGGSRESELRPVRGDVIDPGASGPGRAGVASRPTVRISGRGAEGYASRNGTRPSAAQRHSQLKRHERAGFRPDRVAMWAVLLGVIMMLAAATSSHAAVLAVHHALALH